MRFTISMACLKKGIVSLCMTHLGCEEDEEQGTEEGDAAPHPRPPQPLGCDATAWLQGKDEGKARNNDKPVRLEEAQKPQRHQQVDHLLGVGIPHDHHSHSSSASSASPRGT